MSEMVERMAMAMDEHWKKHGLDSHQPYHLGMARAALEAMREPTSTMLKASCGAMSEGKRPTPDRVSSKEKHRIRYRAMIDAELSRQTFAEAVAVPNGERA